ncbi:MULTISPECIES: heme-binding protein [unclassified Acinetobacter]|uniref:GlcG/HbpS family heme-binding protein n=1 Tax=unclassified Acinetobacter TaxID=196816 RepID=UPI0029348836|nr:MULTISPECIES: heme-binding protein [unclassified Acinetobacter]WOE32013.1 heme-binding protein [Acinetobacter sp. SAAs470]WOE37481.1 heme-binding protein [Acinetobacter sp. SAAs474]
MQTQHYLTLSDAEFLLDQAYQYALQQNFNVSIVIVDASGALLAMKRMDGASALTAQICLDKAQCSAMSRRPSKFYEDLILQGRSSFLSISNFHGAVEGGEPILYQGQLVGAIGVSGVQSCQDADIAQYAIQQFLAHVAATS